MKNTLRLECWKCGIQMSELSKNGLCIGCNNDIINRIGEKRRVQIMWTWLWVLTIITLMGHVIMFVNLK
jgi:hypothetical protein